MEKHPKSLRIFFATEMWERYGFYAVQSLLALYLAMHYKWPDREVYALVGSFTALTYLSPLVGGWIADKLIGQKRAILLGASILFFSYCILSWFDTNLSLIFSLAGIAVGTGLLKPNISSLLGNEYPISSPRRESGFTIFYMGITTGIVLGTIVPSQLSLHFCWAAAFLSAAIGMIIAAATFVYGIYYYKINDYNHFELQLKNVALVCLILLGLWSLSFFILSYSGLANIMFGLVVIFSASYLLYAVSTENTTQARKTLIIGLLCTISMIFWAFYFQMFMSWTLFISRVVEPKLWGILFPAPYYVTIQSLGMLFIGYFLSKKTPTMNLVERGLSTTKKFLLAMLLMTLSYLVIVLSIKIDSGPTLLTPLLIIPAYLMFSLAELLLSPVGLCAITVLACKHKVSTMMGIFFVSLGMGGFLSGKLSVLTAIPSGETNLLLLKSLYAKAFSLQLGILFIASLFCLLIFTVIKFLLTHIPSEE